MANERRSFGSYENVAFQVSNIDRTNDHPDATSRTADRRSRRRIHTNAGHLFRPATVALDNMLRFATARPFEIRVTPDDSVYDRDKAIVINCDDISLQLIGPGLPHREKLPSCCS